MKRLSALLAVSLLLCSLCACKKDEQNNTENQATTTIFETNGTTEAQTTTSIAENVTTTVADKTTTLATKAETTTTTKLATTKQEDGTKRTTTTTTAKTTTTTTTKATTTTTAAPTFLNPKTNIKWEKEYVSKRYTVYDETAISAGGISFFNDAVDGEYVLVLEAMFETQNPGDRKGVTHNGKTYYRCGGGQTPHRMEMTDKEIIIKDSFWENNGATNLVLVLQNDGNLKVTQSKLPEFTVGDILSISYNGLK